MTASQEAPALGQNSAVFVTGAARSDGREWWAPQVQPDEVPDSAILNADGRSLLFGFHEPAARGKEALEAIAAGDEEDEALGLGWREELMGLQLEWSEDKRACEAVAHAGTLGRHSGRT